MDLKGDVNLKEKNVKTDFFYSLVFNSICIYMNNYNAQIVDRNNLLDKDDTGFSCILDKKGMLEM